ncbi:MAG TPA: GNAT family N-acetyltransferase [Candidatus Eisenbacteria bacterium]
MAETPQPGGLRGAAKVLESQRLILRRFSLEDAAFALALVNDPAWLKYIGDRNVRTVEDARAYLRKGALDMYERFGFGMYVVTLKGSGEPIGTCGLIKRESLDDVDIGFAFLPQFRGQGFALESAVAVLEHGKRALGLKRIVAIVSPANRRSIAILEKIGLKFERKLKLPGEDEEISLYAYESEEPAGS